MCYVTTPLRKMPQAQLADRDRVVSRTIEVRDTTALYAAGPEFETGTSSPRHTHFGRIYRSGGERLFSRADLQLLLITFRLQAPSVSWQPEPWRVVDDNVLIDNIRCVKLRREIEPKPIEGRPLERGPRRNRLGQPRAAANVCRFVGRMKSRRSHVHGCDQLQEGPVARLDTVRGGAVIAEPTNPTRSR